jgi:hypothetical protein
MICTLCWYVHYAADAAAAAAAALAYVEVAGGSLVCLCWLNEDFERQHQQGLWRVNTMVPQQLEWGNGSMNQCNKSAPTVILCCVCAFYLLFRWATNSSLHEISAWAFMAHHTGGQHYAQGTAQARCAVHWAVTWLLTDKGENRSLRCGKVCG